MFATEKDLVKMLKLNFDPICSWNKSDFNTEIVEEVNVGFGIADLVITQVNNSEHRSIPLNYFDILIYKIIETDENVSFDTLQTETKANRSKIQLSLSKLLQESYINEKDSFFVIKNAYKNITIKSIAIEAKLRDWKKALEQAFRYKWFATQSYVVMDSKNISPAIKFKNKFVELNIGLAEIDMYGNMKIHYIPKEAQPIDEKMMILFNETIKLHLTTKKIGFPSI